VPQVLRQPRVYITTTTMVAVAVMPNWPLS
jgi:hypothetical protein